MLDRVIARLSPQVDRMALNANGDPARFVTFGLPVIADPVGGYAGPLAGVLAGLDWAWGLGGLSHAVTVAADTPFFPETLVSRLAAENGEADRRIVLAGSGGNRHPVFGLWPVLLRDDLRRFLDRTETFKVMAFVGETDYRIVDFPLIEAGGSQVDPFFNANTPEDIATAERIAAEGAA
jgi:molybdopterin-guanine dinucleotide biosynthesis protein A